MHSGKVQKVQFSFRKAVQCPPLAELSRLAERELRAARICLLCLQLEFLTQDKLQGFSPLSSCSISLGDIFHIMMFCMNFSQKNIMSVYSAVHLLALLKVTAATQHDN